MNLSIKALIISTIILFQTLGTAQEVKNRFINIDFYSNSLETSIFQVNPYKRLAVYLPPNYYESKKEYPVVYYLPGFTSPVEELINGEYEGFVINQVLDDLISQNQIKEMIVVLCDGSNFLGGSFYMNSPLTGNFEDYIVKDVVNYIDSNYRTVKSSKARGIVGHSMGGFGAINLAKNHPDIFSICYAMSPGIYNQTGLQDQGLFNKQEKIDFFQNLIKEFDNVNEDVNKHNLLKLKVKSLYEQGYYGYFLAFTIAYGSAFSYNLDLPFPHINFPNHLQEANSSNAEIFELWQNGFGGWASKIVDYKTNLESLDAIAFDCGYKDGWITLGSRYLVDLFEKKGIQVDSFWFDGGHDDKLHIRLQKNVFQYFSAHFKY